MTPTKSGYFEAYYEENKDRINNERRRRYHMDPEYRTRVLDDSRRYRDNKRGPTSRRVRMPRYHVPMVKETGDGGEIRLFSVGAFAVSLGRSVQAINNWERAGILPQTPYRDRRGFRYYTTDMMAAARHVAGEKRRLFPADPSMHDSIRREWTAQGVPLPTIEADFSAALEATEPKPWSPNEDIVEEGAEGQGNGAGE